MLSVQTIQIIIASGVVGGVIGFIAGIPYLKKKGIDVSKGIDTAKAADPVINAASTLLPNNKAIDILKTIEKWSTIAVGQAQQLYYAESIEKDERISTAQNVVYNALLELNIPLDENKKNLINAAIENAVKDLGHNKTEDEQIAEKQALQAQLAQVTAERDSFKNTIAQVNATTAQTTPGDTTNKVVQATTCTVQNNTVTQ
ncbi:hypothetical protein [Clostridium sp. JS66]|uniref:hypothetical protein n=1 Tax=Clostridium sp. JS66 TaxID=3064705 RepID=UPI00298DF62E|nr:hypothetical protein [Clostridium sp. JS66]WPC42785.1 hypothetical protein Q6H37_04765 [Clostridium sp. JS66]